jgi:hypothetical protein
MITYKIEYDLTELKNLADNFAKNVQNAPEAALPNTAAAFQRASNVVRQMWIDKISNLPETTSAMVRSIKEKRNGDFDYSVYSDNRQMEQLNNGTKAVEYDMKRTHPYGKKSRVTQSGKNKGVPYLIIPFRWGTPNGKDTNGKPLPEWKTTKESSGRLMEFGDTCSMIEDPFRYIYDYLR